MPKENKIRLIGENAEILSSENKQLIGMSGRVIDETRNTIRIQLGSATKTLSKKIITFKTKNDIIIDGKKIIGRIDERIKNVQ
jgi:ribonuclease P protein subunit POP4